MRKLGAVLTGLLIVPLAVQTAIAQGNTTSKGNSTGSTRSIGHVSEAKMEFTGSRTLKSITPARGQRTRSPSTEFAPNIEKDLGEAAPTTNMPAPRPRNTPIVVSQARDGWQALNHTDQRLAGGGNQFSLEPPDQGLCVGNSAGTTFVFESVNDALTVYDSNSGQLIPPVTLSQFFGLAPTINRTTGRYGPFVSDPKCYYDRDTHRWFHSVLIIGQNPKTGAFTDRAFTALAVSKTSDPLGAYYQYRINAVDRNQPNCPCFGDQPLIGADKNGFYVSTAEYPLFKAGFNGAQLYAMSKRALEAGRVPTVVHYSKITRKPVNGRTTGTLQPAISPGTYATGNGGTEFFMSAFDCVPGDCAIAGGQFNKISVWSLTNTQSLSNVHPHVTLTRKNLTSEVYGQPDPQTQRPGPRPLGTDPAVKDPLPKVEPNDSRMNQVIYAAGHLWGGINTAVAPGARTGIGYFVVRPGVRAGHVTASITKQGYIAATETNLSFPSIGVNRAGEGVVAYSLMGPRYYPSAAYSRITSAGTRGPVHIARMGYRPEDGFTCYPELAGPTEACRWGDYSASVAGPDGRIWSATEMIGDRARTYYANWGTFIWPLRP